MFSMQPGFHIKPEFQPLARIAGLDAEAVFDHPEIVAWRKLPDRENCTLDIDLSDGGKTRWHIKRYLTASGAPSADAELRGHRLLVDAGVPTLDIVAHGSLADGRSFVITNDLAGYDAADKLIERGATTFDALLEPTAQLAARLHNAELHHRDLYLCHFFIKLDGAVVADARLIDVARVAKLASRFTKRRWIVKDLAQFWYSTIALDVTDEQRNAWLERYVRERGVPSIDGLRRSIERKSNAIARHDKQLRAKQPTRNISISH